MTFSDSFIQGLSHITDLDGYDHMLFLLALCAVYEWQHIRRVAILVTAFTIGHSVTLIFASLDGTAWLPSDIIEFLIPVTIAITCIYNLIAVTRIRRWSVDKESPGPKYMLALLFGLIHGFGFSNYFRMISMEGEGYVANLFGFNLGVEIGQIIVVIIMLTITFVFLNIFRVRQRDWTVLLSGIALGVTFLLLRDTWPF